MQTLLRSFNVDSRGTPREVLSRSVMAAKSDRKWRLRSSNEEAALTELWQNYPYFFNSSCADYKRHHKRAGDIAGVKSKGGRAIQQFIYRY